MNTRRIITKAIFQMTEKLGEYLPLHEESFDHAGPVAEAIAMLGAPPAVIPGVVTRPFAPNDVITETQGATPFAAYGLPAKISANTVIPISANNDPVYGFLVRPFPQQSSSLTDDGNLYSGVPDTAGPADILRKGYIGVNCQLGTPAKGAQVYIRYQNPSGQQIVGGVEAGTTGNNYAATGWFFNGTKDANGNVEIYSA